MPRVKAKREKLIGNELALAQSVFDKAVKACEVAGHVTRFPACRSCSLSVIREGIQAGARWYEATHGTFWGSVRDAWRAWRSVA